MKETRRIKCKNRDQKVRNRSNATRYDGGCRGCPLVYTHKADSWLDDIVRCESPVPIKYGDTVEIVPQAARIVGGDDG